MASTDIARASDWPRVGLLLLCGVFALIGGVLPATIYAPAASALLILRAARAPELQARGSAWAVHG